MFTTVTMHTFLTEKRQMIFASSYTVINQIFRDIQAVSQGKYLIEVHRKNLFLYKVLFM